MCIRDRNIILGAEALPSATSEAIFVEKDCSGPSLRVRPLEKNFLQNLGSILLRKLPVSRDLDIHSRVTHQCERLGETHPGICQAKPEPSPFQSY